MKHLVYITSFFVIVSFCTLIAAKIAPVNANEAVNENASDYNNKDTQPESLIDNIDSPDYQKLGFDVYAGGLHAVRADMEVDYRDKGFYSIIFNAETRGVLGSIVPWKGSFLSKGWVLDNDKVLAPKLHESVSYWHDEEEIKSYNYEKNGEFKNIVTLYKHKKPRTRIPDEELTKDTIDALTATMVIMRYVADGKKCEGFFEIFDGKRRYKLVFTHKGFVNLKKSRYNAYEGQAAECIVEVQPLAGLWHKKPRGWLSIQEQGRERGMMPTVWFAQVRENAVAVPVKVRVKTAYGTLFMHMTAYESGDIVLTTK